MQNSEGWQMPEAMTEKKTKPDQLFVVNVAPEEEDENGEETPHTTEGQPSNEA